MDRRLKHKEIPPEEYRNQQPFEFYKYPKNLATVRIDGEDVRLGPILDKLLKERGVGRKTVVRRTALDFRSLRDFLMDKEAKLGPAGVSQIMHAGNITIQDIIDQARRDRTTPTNLNEDT